MKYNTIILKMNLIFSVKTLIPWKELILPNKNDCLSSKLKKQVSIENKITRLLSLSRKFLTCYLFSSNPH